jgi:hypothetical protein
MSEPAISRRQNILVFALVVLLVAALLLGWLGAIILINKYYPDSAISAEDVLNYILVGFIAIIYMPWIQARTYRRQSAAFESRQSQPVAVTMRRFGLLSVAALSLLLAFGPLSVQRQLYSWAYGTGLVTRSIYLIELVFLVVALLIIGLAAALSTIFPRPNSKTSPAPENKDRVERAKIWLSCFGWTYGLCAALCVLAGFFILRFL